MTTVDVPIYDDTYINAQAATTNYLAAEELLMGEHWGGLGSFRRIALFRVDLTKFYVNVTSATLSMTQYAGGYGAGRTLAARRCLKPYVASQVTYNQYATGQTWDRDIADDDFSSTTYGDFTPTDSSGVKTMDLTTMVNAFKGGVLAIGLAFTGATASQNSMFVRSMDYTTVGDRPTLSIVTPDLWIAGSTSPMVMG